MTLPVTALMGVLSAAVAVRYVGADTYGYVSLVAQLVLLLPFADLGLGAAITRKVAQSRHGQSSGKDAAALTRRAITLLSVFGLIATAGAIATGLLGGWSQLFSAPAGLVSSIDLTTTLVLAIFFLSLPLALAQRVLIGYDRSALLVLLGFLPPTANLFFICIASSLGLSPMTLALGTAFGSFFGAACSAAFAFSPKLGGLDLREGTRSGNARAEVAEIAGSAVPMLLTAAGTAVAFQSGRIILANFGSPSDLTEFALAFQLYLPVWSIVYMGSTILWPRFAVGGDVRLWATANATLTVLGASAGVAFVTIGPLLVRFMSEGNVTLTPAVAWSFAALLTAQAMFSTQSMVLTDASGLTIQAVFSLLLAAGAVPLSALLSSQFGAAGPALAAAVCAISLLVPPTAFASYRRMRHHPKSATD